jgi:transcription elongation factor GreA
MKVKVEIMGNQMEFLLGSREISTGDLDVYSEQSPLGSAVMGAKLGDTRTYTAPNGKVMTVKVIAADFFA